MEGYRSPTHSVCNPFDAGKRENRNSNASMEVSGSSGRANVACPRSVSKVSALLARPSGSRTANFIGEFFEGTVDHSVWHFLAFNLASTTARFWSTSSGVSGNASSFAFSRFMAMCLTSMLNVLRTIFCRHALEKNVYADLC